MCWNKPTPDDERLAQWLREDALRQRPEFSESLHRRICGAIEQIRKTPMPAEDNMLPRARRPSGWLAAALAASLILAALIGWQFSRTTPVTQLPIDPPVPAEASSTIAPSSDASPAEGTAAPLVAGGATPIAPAASVGEASRMLGRIDLALASSQWAFLDHDAQLAWQLVTQMLPVPAAPKSGEDR